MKLGPKGMGVTKTESVTAKRTWTFPREFLVDRLGLPEDTVFTVELPDSGGFVSPVSFLRAEATEVRRPKKEGNS